ncbi:hypothetical protein [Kozakia baliensis]|uniref:hypothetical protein n=1 Tax=Kozakia baliensis TaxID=153496 RepID=UPI000496EBF1|nr:hypothetical protein [Kozakia baliensis]
MDRSIFDRVNDAARSCLPAILDRWLPDGVKEGDEWVALNPTRADAKRGSFKVNLRTGRWSDFAVPDARGGDPVSLTAYLFKLKQHEAAKHMAAMLGIS